MRLLVSCPRCARQYDASDRPPESRFRCLCGTAVTVPRPTAHDAAVVRCAACGAPRQEGAAACGFCGADFTLHERDLHTICPACMARVSDRARYCHHCATALLPQELGSPTRHLCPTCGDAAPPLLGRALDGDAVPILECQRCAGLWLGREAFSVVLDRARRDGAVRDDRRPPRAGPLERQSGALYRPCPHCGALMHRRNYGRKSGVIVDSCSEHGIWFDARELDELLAWVRRGGETEAARRQAEETTRLDRQRRLHEEIRSSHAPAEARSDKPWLLEALGDLVSWLLD